MKPFSLKSQNFGVGQTIWADPSWDIFGQFITTHFGTVSLCPCFPLIKHFFYKKTAFISKSQIFIWDWNLDLGCKELGILILMIFFLIDVRDCWLFPKNMSNISLKLKSGTDIIATMEI